MRSMARWVLPVLVGPSTAVTPAPRAPVSRLVEEEGEEKEMGIDDLTCGPSGVVARVDRAAHHAQIGARRLAETCSADLGQDARHRSLALRTRDWSSSQYGSDPGDRVSVAASDISPGLSSFVYHNATGKGPVRLRERPVLKLWNESGTNRARIADSMPVGIRSRPHLALSGARTPRSSRAPESNWSPLASIR